MRVMQPLGRLRDGDDEDEIEEQFERRRGAMRLVRRPSAHGRVKARHRAWNGAVSSVRHSRWTYWFRSSKVSRRSMCAVCGTR